MVTQKALQFFFSLLQSESGLSLDDSKQYLIETRLEPIAIQEGFTSIDGLVRHMKENASSVLRQKVIDAMTTNETSFFRDITPFETMRKEILPNLLKANEKSRRLRIWSAGCSTGQEAYSIAMLLCDLGPSIQNWNVSIMATDIAEKVLQRAKTGIYSQHEVQRGLPVTYLTRYFNQDEMQWEIKPEVKRFLEFRKLNFLSGFSSLGAFDVIFCRNVLIYFDVNTKKKVLEQIAETLAPNGSLFLGGAEMLLGVTNDFVRFEMGRGSYYKKKEPSSQIKDRS